MSDVENSVIPVKTLFGEHAFYLQANGFPNIKSKNR